MKMTRAEYEQRFRDLAEKISDLSGELIALKSAYIEDEPISPCPKPPHPKPELRAHQEYYYISSYGGSIYTKYDDTRIENRMRDIGNVFLTEEAAEYAVEYFKVLSEMREWAGNWHDKWRLYYCDGRIEPEAVYIGEYVTYGEMRFATEADARNCIKAVGEDRLKKYYFCVPEVHECCTSES